MQGVARIFLKDIVLSGQLGTTSIKRQFYEIWLPTQECPLVPIQCNGGIGRLLEKCDSGYQCLLLFIIVYYYKNVTQDTGVYSASPANTGTHLRAFALDKKVMEKG